MDGYENLRAKSLNGGQAQTNGEGNGDDDDENQLRWQLPDNGEDLDVDVSHSVAPQMPPSG